MFLKNADLLYIKNIGGPLLKYGRIKYENIKISLCVNIMSKIF